MLITLRVIASRRSGRIVVCLHLRLLGSAYSLLCGLPSRKTAISCFLLVTQRATKQLWSAILNLPCGAGDRGRTGTILSYHGILSPGRLPVPPHRRTVTSAALAIIPHPPRIVNPFFSFYLKKFSTNYRFRRFLKIY